MGRVLEKREVEDRWGRNEIGIEPESVDYREIIIIFLGSFCKILFGSRDQESFNSFSP